MPVYQYECKRCGHKTEFLEKANRTRKHSCEKCGSSDMKKLFSSFSVGQSSQANGSCPTGTCPLS